jgi:apolipoprotein N-acyltransferase
LVPVAAWLAPVFLLRFTRTQRPLVALTSLVVVMSLTSLVALRDGFFPIVGGIGYAVFVAGLGLFSALPYAVDRLLVSRLGTVARTLVFPAAVTAVDLIGMVTSPFGAAGSIAYSQHADLPLVQLVSVTGIWGLTFLMSWLAPVLNELWERSPTGHGRVIAMAPFVAALVGALIFGGARLAFAGAAPETVRVAALAPDRALSDAAFSAPPLRPGTPAERAAVREAHFRPVLEELVERSRREAQAGAEIIAWSEAAALVLVEDLPAVVDRAAALADQEDVYLQVSLIALLTTAEGTGSGPVNENHAVLLDPDGKVVWDYLKSKPVPGDGHLPGPGVVPVVDTPHGRLATVICQDDMFPALVAQAGRADVDILLVPSSDWAAVADWHAQQAAFRAVENGVAVIRPTRQGVSLATDAYGRFVGYKGDYFLAQDQTLVTSVPTRGIDTGYAIVRDGFGYAAVLGVVALAGWAVVRRRRGRAG